MLSCQRCKQTTNGPQAFLLTCRGCSKIWHHRCHMPPIEDEELIRRIRATNAGDRDDGLGAWTCRRCKKGVSQTPSVVSSREPTVSTESREDSASHASPAVTTTTTSTAAVAATVDGHVKQESTGAVYTPLDDRERNKQADRPESTEAASVKRNLTAKRTKLSAVTRPHVQPQPDPTQTIDADVQMADATLIAVTPTEKPKSPQRPSYQTKCARKYPSTVPATSSEDDVHMNVDVFSETTSRAASRASQTPFSDNQAIGTGTGTGTGTVAEAPPQACTASSTKERERAVRLADASGSAILPRVHQAVANDDDDPDDLYGPPVERRIIRILPSLAEELKEQQRRTAVEKEKRRAPLAPDWILARHAHDPFWKEVPTEGRRKRRKPAARKLGDNGLNANELMGCFTVQNWVREHKT